MEKIYDTKKYFTRDVNRQIKLYTLDEESNVAKVIGSLSYKSGNASDTDLFEQVYSKTKDDAIILFTKNIKRIANKLNNLKDQYFLEVKLGLDHLFDIQIGTCSNNSFIMDASLPDILSMRKAFFSDKEWNVIEMIISSPQKTQEHFEVMKYIIRSHSVLRWSIPELNKGFKILKDIHGRKYEYFIEDGICEKAQSNIEGIFIDENNKYVECSNFFVLEYSDENGVHHLLNLSDDILNDFSHFTHENLTTSAYTLMNSKINCNVMKAVKRLLSYSRSFRNLELMSKVYPIVNSHLGTLYYLMSQLKTVHKIINGHGKKYLYKQILYHTLDLIRFKLQELIFVEYDFSDIFSIINDVLSKDIYVHREQLTDAIHNIADGVMKYINQHTIMELQNVGLYPLPPSLCPSVKPF